MQKRTSKALKSKNTGEDAVSPVVGVMLLLVVTVIIAAVVATFASGLVTTQHNKKYDFATLHNWGCTFHCPFCSYKLRGGADSKPGFMTPKPASFLTTEEIKTVLSGQRPKTVSLMGGEPSLAPDLDELLAFAKEELGAKTKLGHTNGTRIPTENLDYANVGFKAWSKDLHYKITGKPKELIYTNFENA